MARVEVGVWTNSSTVSGADMGWDVVTVRVVRMLEA